MPTYSVVIVLVVQWLAKLAREHVLCCAKSPGSLADWQAGRLARWHVADAWEIARTYRGATFVYLWNERLYKGLLFNDKYNFLFFSKLRLLIANFVEACALAVET